MQRVFNDGPGEWQRDANGKRYRMVGNIKEYETTIRTSGGDVPESKIEAFNRNEEERREKMLEDARKTREKIARARICPGSEKTCTMGACVMYIEGIGCRLALIPDGYRPAQTKGKSCPFYRDAPTKCGEFCEMYKGGCALTAGMEVTR